MTRFAAWAKLGPFVPLVAVLLVGAVLNAQGAFFEWQTHRAVLREVAVGGILASGMTVVIVSGGIDLAVGSLLGFSAVSFAWLTLAHGWPGLFAIPAVLAVGAVLGAFSGALVAWPRLQPFIVTLAMMVFARGLAKELSGGQKISTYVHLPDGRFESVPLPRVFEALDGRVLGDNVSVVTLVFLASALVTWLILERLRIGRYLFAVGDNFEAARLSGVPVRATLLFAYVLSGIFAAVAGICQAAQETHGDPETGMGYELDAIAMVVLGGTSLSGGRGGVHLTVIGALTLGYLQKVLSLNAYSTELRLMLTGVILVLAAVFQRRFGRLDLRLLEIRLRPSTAMLFTVECATCAKRMSVPEELYEKRVRGRAALLACRGCGSKIRLDGTAGGPPPKVTGGTWLENVPEPAAEEEPQSLGAEGGVRPIARIGRYALFEQFAEGGMATVHFGRLDGAGGFQRVVAIKRLLPQLVMNEEFTQMLLKEARLAARVRNPNVVPTVDVVASKGDVLLVLEYVHGESLSALCRTQARERRAHIPLDVAIGVMHGVLQGLDAVHEATDEQGRPLGLVHRDVSPPNVIVGADGHTRVLDFGIAKALEHIEDSNPTRVKGKAGYMSPEQIRGERLTQRSDVFSAGIILWELLATRRLFMADTETERMQKILDGNYPSPSRYRPELGPALDAVAMRALSLDPEQRFASCHEFVVALEQAAPGASSRRIAEWVNDLAAENLAIRARMVADVENWSSGVPDLPLNSTPFAAEAAVLMTAPPPGVTTNPPPSVHPPAQAPLPSAPPPAVPSFKEASAARFAPLVVGAVIVAGIVATYVALR